VSGLLGRLVLAVAATAFALGLGEAYLRVAAPEWAPQHAERVFWSHDPLLGWAHRPGESGVLRHPDFAVEVTINARGLRDRDYPLERVPGRRRMLVLGDSFAWGFGVAQHEILSERIEARHPQWEIVNAGVSGYGTDQQLLWLREHGLAFQPDWVLLLLHPNDVDDNAAVRRYGYPKPRFVPGPDGLELAGVPVPPLGWRERTRRFLKQRSYLWNRVQHLRLVDEASAAPPLEPPPASFSVTAALLRALDELVTANGARLAVVSTAGEPWLQRAMADTLAPLGVPYLSLDDAFRGQPRDEVKFAHDPHWNAAGHALAADAVEAFLQTQGILAATAPASPQQESP